MHRRPPFAVLSQAAGLTLACLTVGTVACVASPEPDERVLEGAQALIGGEAAPADSGAVLVMIKKVNYTKPFEWCTGAVVSPHVVVTAAHCVAVTPLDVPTDAKLSIFIGDSYDYDGPSPPPDLFYEIAGTQIDPDYTDASARTKGHDIAVIVTKEALPVTPYPMLDGPLDDALVGQTVRLLGAGADVLPSTGEYSAGVRKSVGLPVTALDDHYIHEQGEAGSTCEGDSGGPTLLTRDGAEILIGIHAATVGAPACTGANYDTRLDLYLDSLIRPAIAAADPDLVGEGGAGGTTSSSSNTTTGGSNPTDVDDGGCSIRGRSRDGTGSALLAAIVGLFALGARRIRHRGTP